MTTQSSLKTLIVATNNPHKAEEFSQILGDDWNVLTAKDIGNISWDESGTTFFENSSIKALAVYNALPENLRNALVIADDSGLCVDALNGGPGVYSSRYAGEEGNNEANNELLLLNMKDVPKDKRAARFICVLTIVKNGDTLKQIEGVMEGSIIGEKMGTKGFGYDPLFVPKGFDMTAAQLKPEDKNQISHRGKALKKFSEWVRTQSI